MSEPVTAERMYETLEHTLAALAERDRRIEELEGERDDAIASWTNTAEKAIQRIGDERQRAERYEVALQEVAAASIAVVSADELQDIAAAALQDSKETE